MADQTIIDVIQGLDPKSAWDMRWHFVADMNLDGQVTISDVWLWAAYVFCAPGDVFLLTIMTKMKPLAAFLEMTPKMVYGWWSFFISAFVWWCIIGGMINESREAKQKRARK